MKCNFNKHKQQKRDHVNVTVGLYSYVHLKLRFIVQYIYGGNKDSIL